MLYLSCVVFLLAVVQTWLFKCYFVYIWYPLPIIGGGNTGSEKYFLMNFNNL